VKEFTRVRPVAAVSNRPSQALSAVSRLDTIIAMAAVLALGITAFLALPTYNWLLLLLSGGAALGTHHIVWSHPRARFQRLDDTALFLFVPVLFTLGIGLFLEEVAEGDWTIGAGLLSVVLFWLVLRAEYGSVDRRAKGYQLWRGVLNGFTYITALLFFATIYDFELSLLTASFAAGIVSLLLAIEVLREEAMDTSRTIIHAVAIGVLLAQAAWATHFLPLDGGWAVGVFLLLALYLMTGMMHNYLAGRLNLRTAGEFTVVALVGIAGVILTQSYV